MNKRFLIAPIIIVIALVVILGLDGNEKEDEPVFHVTLASPEQYQNGLYVSNFEIEPGKYQFRFVPNGDSPQKLIISLEGENFQFSEQFVLNGTKHQTGISEYFTWDYNGKKLLDIPENQEVTIKIDPNGNIMGPISISLIKYRA